MNAIILFTKVPMANFSKTRLLTHLTPQECEELQEILLTKIHEVANKFICSTKENTDLFIFYTPKDAFDKLDNLLHEKRYFDQRGEDIFDKMKNAFDIVFNLGYDKVILIGSDIYGLSESDIEKSFKVLSNNDVVIGNTFDEGYYLIGMKKTNKIFKVNSKFVFDSTIKNIKSANLKYEIIDRKRDIDTFEDLEFILNNDVNDKNLLLKIFLNKIFNINEI